MKSGKGFLGSITGSIFIRFIIVTVLILASSFGFLIRAVSGHMSDISHENLNNVAGLSLKIAQTSFEFYQDALLKDIDYIEGEIDNRMLLHPSKKIIVSAQNQITKKTTNINIPVMLLGDTKVAFNNTLVDRFSKRTGNTTTVFQIIRQGMLRISTSVRKKDGTRAVGTYIPSDSPVVKTVMSGKSFSGRAFVVDQWYITHYKPLYQNKKIIGMLYSGVPQNDVDRLKNKILSVKVGKSGYSFIIDTRGEIVIHPTASGNEISGKSWVEKILKNRDGTVEFTDSEKNGEIATAKVAVYRYLPEMNWIIAAVAYKSELNETLYSIFMIALIALIAGVCVNMIAAYFVGISIAQPVKRIADILKDIARGGGDLTLRIENHRKDEIGEMADWFNIFIDKIENMISDVKNKVKTITESIETLAGGNEELSTRTTEQAASLEETASSMEEMTAAIKSSAENAARAYDITVEGHNNTMKGVEVINNASVQMKKINDSNDHITQITMLIENIAFQTNILSLNAAVEAARAGEHGRGFAVVATEVRTLAQNTSVSVKEINDLITANTDKIIQGSSVVEEAGVIIDDLRNTVNELAALMNEIKNTSFEHQKGLEQVNKAVSQLDGITQQNGALVEEFAASNQELAVNSKKLLEMMNYFKVREN